VSLDMNHTLEMVVERIITLNHGWKLAREEFGNNSAITNSLKNQKSSWQSSLLREFPNQSYLKVDRDNSTDDEILFSVRLTYELTINNVKRNDAEHLPKRIALELFCAEELNQLLNKMDKPECR